MSIEFCHEHDRVWDSDFNEHCPACLAVLLTRRLVAEAFEHLCCDRPQGCEGVFGVDGYCRLAPALDALFGPADAAKPSPLTSTGCPPSPGKTSNEKGSQG